jgi:hypothetical protein
LLLFTIKYLQLKSKTENKNLY